jgi:hypothetical protein
MLIITSQIPEIPKPVVKFSFAEFLEGFTTYTMSQQMALFSFKALANSINSTSTSKKAHQVTTK